MARDRMAIDGGPVLPPHNSLVEQSLLGAILSRNNLLEACGNLQADHFFEPIHRQIFGIISNMILEGRRADPRTMVSALPEKAITPNGMTASQYVARLLAEAVSERLQDVQRYARELTLLAWKRASSERLEDVQDILVKGDPADLLTALRETATAIEATAPEVVPEIKAWDAGDDPDPKELPPREWMMATQFCKQFISGVIGPGGVGKTSLRVLQFIAMAIGKDLTGHHVFRRCRVLIVGLEDSCTELQRRIAAARIHHRIPKEDLKGWLHYVTIEELKGMKLATMSPDGPQKGKLAAVLRRLIQTLNLDVVGIDPTIKAHELNENLNKEMDFVCDLLTEMAIEFSIAVDLSMHARKGPREPGDSDAGRGASSVRDGGRLIQTLTSMSEEEAKAFGIEPDDRCDYVRLDRGKVNIIRKAGAADWFRLADVPLNNGSEMYPNGDHVQTVEVWDPPETWAGLLYTALNAALDEIERGVIGEGGNPNGAAGAAKDRAAWRIVKKHCPGKTDAQCREIIRTWVTNGVLTEREYDDHARREKCLGLYVNTARRPGKEVPE
jgi:AAA domain/DnaB-like helicase N terminal domain